MTAHGPEHGTEKILKNNYGEHVQKGKADYYFKFSTSQLLLQGVQCESDEGRIVWRFPKTLFLNSVWYYCEKTGEYDYSRSYTKPAEPKKEPESEGWWSTILVLGTVAVIGYGLVKRFHGRKPSLASALL